MTQQEQDQQDEVMYRLFHLNAQFREIDPDTDEAVMMRGEIDKLTAELEALDEE